MKIFFFFKCWPAFWRTYFLTPSRVYISVVITHITNYNLFTWWTSVRSFHKCFLVTIYPSYWYVPRGSVYFKVFLHSRLQPLVIGQIAKIKSSSIFYPHRSCSPNNDKQRFIFHLATNHWYRHYGPEWDLNLGPKQQYSLLDFEISVS